MKDFCSFVNTNYKKVLGDSKTRWLSLHPALYRLIDMFDGLKSYFSSIDKCLSVIKSFFENPISLLVATFLRLQSELFLLVICELEGDNILVIEVKIQVDSLVEKLKGRKEGNCTTLKKSFLLNV